MTKNQLEYRAQNEIARANRAKEVIQQSYNDAMLKLEHDKLAQNLAIAQANLDETSRANKAREQENYRSNVAKETEVKRSNLANEMERYRSAVASLDELTRHNISSETLNAESNSITRDRAIEEARRNQALENLQRESLRYNYANLGYMYSTLQETTRSNLARETETNRSNLARESETERSNLVSEGLRRGQLDETRRSNSMNEYYTGIKLSNEAAYNKDRIRLGFSQLKETARSNRNKEYIAAVNAGANIAGTIISMIK